MRINISGYVSNHGSLNRERDAAVTSPYGNTLWCFIITFSDDTVVLGLISNNDETTYLDEVETLTS